MSQQINLISGRSLSWLPTSFHVSKSIDWKVAGCFAIVAGSLIFLALRFMRQAPTSSLDRSTTGSSSLPGRIDKPADKEPKLEPKEEGSSVASSPVKPSDSSAGASASVPPREVTKDGWTVNSVEGQVLAGRIDKPADKEPKLEPKEEGSSVASSPVKPSDSSAGASASALPREVTKDGWTVNSVEGQVTVSFSMKSNDVLDATKQFVTEKGGSIPCDFGGFRRWLTSEIFTLNEEDYYLSFRQNDEHIDEMRFSLEKAKTSNFTKAVPSSLILKYVYKIGNNEPQEGTKPLDFSKEASLTLLTPRRCNRVSVENMITFTVIFMQAKTS